MTVPASDQTPVEQTFDLAAARELLAGWRMHEMAPGPVLDLLELALDEAQTLTDAFAEIERMVWHDAHRVMDTAKLVQGLRTGRLDQALLFRVGGAA